MLNYVIGPLLFIVLCFVIYNKIKDQANLQQTWDTMQQSITGGNKWLVVALFGLMLLNWGIEARKWQILVTPVQHVNYFTAWKAVLSGLALSLFLPNGIGDYFGRIAYMNEGNRLKSVALTIVGSMAQLIITLVGGFIGLIWLKNNGWKETPQLQGLSVFWINSIVSMIGMGILLMLFIYFKLSWLTVLVEKIPFVQKYKWLIEHLETFHRRELTRILFLSFIRYCIFIVQYLLALHIFNVQLSWTNAACTTSVLFLVIAILPTIPLADIGIRSEAGRQLFGLLSANTLGIIVTTAGIWFINLIIPAVAGSLFILSIKLFRNR